MAAMKPIRSTSAKLSAIAIKEGQMIFCSDTGTLYFDISGTSRVAVSGASSAGAVVSFSVSGNTVTYTKDNGQTGTFDITVDSALSATSTAPVQNKIVKAELDKKDITISTDTTTTGMFKSYTVKQGTTQIGVIDIPKDIVVKSGSVVTNPTGQPAGKYIELVLKDDNNTKIYINVADLVDEYTAAASAAQVQIAISAANVISAKIVAGSVGTTEIADAAVTKAKLATTVQTSLGKADSAVQAITTGSANGHISVDGTDVKVKGIDTMAYESTDSYLSKTNTTAYTPASDYHPATKKYIDDLLEWTVV